MKAVGETWRGGRAILRWLVNSPILTLRAIIAAKDKEEARAILAKSFERLLKACRINYVVTGTPPERGRGCVVCYNETSFADVFAFPSTVLPHVDRAAAADLYAWIPFGRRACNKLGIELVSRGKRKGTNRLISRIVAALENGERIAWGGEGRLSGRDEVKRFKRGAALIAIRANVPIVPVAFYGGHQALPLGSIRARPGTIHVHFGDPIDPSEYHEDDVRDLADHLQTVVAQMYAELKAKANASS